MQGKMLRFRIMKSAVVVLRVKVLLFGHFKKAQILGVFVMIGREPERGVIKDRPHNLLCDSAGKHPEPFARFLPAFAALRR
jgi:hypothetical protein